ncbi:OmpA family protein [Bacteroidales bacterium WCE2004]|nr:OmpA family protein [Bacteroidales bacterium WCE2004]
MKKILLLMTMIALASAPVSAQNLLERLANRAKNAAEQNIGNKVEQGVNDILDGKVGKGKNKDKDKGKDKDKKNAADTAATAPGAQAQNVKSDFVRGSVILFEDDFAGEQVGEFPSKWDIESEGSAETAIINGKKYMNFTEGSNTLQPLMTDMKSYLPDVFTLEWDMYCQFDPENNGLGQHELQMMFFDASNARVGTVRFSFRDGGDAFGYVECDKPGGAGSVDVSYGWDSIQDIIKDRAWNHFAISFNKRAFKYYINGVRIVNFPNVAAPCRFVIGDVGDYAYRGVATVVLAAGAVDLYERKTTDLSEAAAAVEKAIAETGKFVTNNILFETGKATLKPESMEEIQRVAEYMKANPTARFEVQGHTDSQGSDKINDPLSQQRAEAVVKALEEQGVDPFNLRPVGKGSHEPVADNGTEEGRAQNRRVEFIKR